MVEDDNGGGLGSVAVAVAVECALALEEEEEGVDVAWASWVAGLRLRRPLLVGEEEG